MYARIGQILFCHFVQDSFVCLQCAVRKVLVNINLLFMLPTTYHSVLIFDASSVGALGPNHEH